MARQSLDPGLGEKLSGNLRRVINNDGSYNVVRTNVPLSAFTPYTYLISTTWGRFFSIIAIGFIVINLVFALIYLLCGLENLHGVEPPTSMNPLLSTFYFSIHTFTTVGYGNISPSGILTNAVTIVEIFIGLLYVALITGLLYGRFSRPTARLVYSKNMLITPHNGGRALMFRVANLRDNIMMELSAEVLCMIKTEDNNKPTRRYMKMELERNTVVMLPTSWTLVHRINEDSPMFNLSIPELKQMEFQVIIMIKGFDDTFSQTVHSRFSYTADDIVEGGRFVISYFTREDGMIEFDMERVHEFDRVELP
ncbi:MAG: hypothetical protein K1X91_09655 [Bacteriodetes bacterium]|nr:hypothetical protein [Bacteroidota bacterium]